MPVQARMNISVVELSNTDYSVLKVAVGLLKKNAIEVNILERGDPSGSIVLIDFDTQAGKDFYSQFNSKRNFSLLLFSKETFSDIRHWIIKKPVRVQTLKDVLFDIYTTLMPASKKSSPLAIENHEKEITFNSLVLTDRILFFILLKVLQEQKIAQIFCPPHSSLFVNAPNGVIASSVSREVLRKIIVNQSNSLKSIRLSDADFEVLAKGQLIMPLHQVLWSAALYGSHGQLIPGHSEQVPVQLKAWPNFSRLEFHLEHMKLAAIMTSQPLSLKQIEQKTGLPWTTIVGFYNAAWATELIIIKPETLPTVSRQNEASKIGLLAKIAQRLKIAF